jgi:hypothetical protein
MKKLASIALFASLFLTLSSFTNPIPKGTQLRLDLPVGKLIKMSCIMNMNYFSDAQLSQKVMSMKMTIDNEYKVLEKTNEGIHTVEFSITRIQMNQSMGGMEMKYDSSNPDNSNPMSQAIAAQLGDVLNVKYIAKINAMGKMVEAPESVAGQVSPEQMMEYLFMDFPEENIRKGYTWKQESSQNMSGITTQMTSEMKVTEVTSKVVTVKQKLLPGTKIEGEALANADLDIKQSAVLKIDKKTGQAKSGKFSASLKMQDPQAGEIFIVTTTSVNEVK